MPKEWLYKEKLEKGITVEVGNEKLFGDDSLTHHLTIRVNEDLKEATIRTYYLYPDKLRKVGAMLFRAADEVEKEMMEYKREARLG